jgi:hypothetical protein
MLRSHRKWHLIVWLVLGPLLLALILLGLAARPDMMENQTTATQEGSP